MLTDNGFLAIRLEGPMQSWGFDSQFNRRNTGLMPTKSAIAGMCCAALGLNRGTDAEKDFLVKFGAIKLTAIAIPRMLEEYQLQLRRIVDYHTVQNTVRASGSPNPNAVITHRQFINDSAFGALLEGESDILNKIASALQNPVWGIWLGRKNCIPTAPVFAGLFDKETDALKCLTVGKKGTFRIEREVNEFSTGVDSLMDQAVCFDSNKRQFSPRRIRRDWISL